MRMKAMRVSFALLAFASCLVLGLAAPAGAAEGSAEGEPREIQEVLGPRADPEGDALAETGSSGGCTASPEERARLLALARAGFELADDAERQRQALDLVDCLGDPDPEIRDAVAYSALASWLRADALDETTRLALAERLLPQVEAAEDAAGFRRPFAALALAEVARADRLEPALPDEVRCRMVEAAARFLESTKDHRGFDDQEGWRHAVAHGADLVLQLGLHPATTEAEARRLMTALATQVAPPGVAYVFGEPSRLARAVFYVHGRGLLDNAFWNEWFAAIGSPAPLPSWSAAFGSTAALARRHDTVAFLHAVTFAARVQPGSECDRLAELAHRELVRIERGEP